MDGYLSPEQIEQLLKQINPRRVSKDGKGYSHIEAYDVRAHLTRILGYGRWSAEVSEMALIFETQHPMDDKIEKRRGKWDVAYRARCTLTICAPDGTGLAAYSEYAVGDTTNQPARGDAHDLACKTAESQALKRCATNLGDQFALSLYNSGSLQPLVGRTLVMPGPREGTTDDAAAEALDIEADLPELTPENTHPPVIEREVSSPRPDQAPATPQEIVAEAFPGAEIVSEEPVDDPDADAVAEITAMVLASRDLPPEEAMQLLKEALELSVARGVRQHRLPTGATIGAALTKMLGERSTEMGEG